MVALTNDPEGKNTGPFRHMWLSFEDSRREAQELKRMVDKLVRDGAAWENVIKQKVTK